MLIASGPFYTSGAFWGVAAEVMVAIIIGVVGAWVVWRSANPKKQLVYTVTEPTPLVTSEPLGSAGAGLLAVTYNATPVADPHVVTIELISRSRRDIRSSDFDGDRPLVFSLDAAIKAMLDCTDRTGVVHGFSRRIELSPCLIRRGKVFKVSLLTEGPPTITCRSSLADVSIEKQENPWQGRRGVPLNARLAAVLLIALWLTLSIVLGVPLLLTHNSVHRVFLFCDYALSTIWLAFAVPLVPPQLLEAYASNFPDPQESRHRGPPADVPPPPPSP